MVGKVLDPVIAVSTPVGRGKILRISQVVGGFCEDLNRFNLLDYKEHLDYRLSRNLRLVSRLRVAKDLKGK